MKENLMSRQSSSRRPYPGLFLGYVIFLDRISSFVCAQEKFFFNKKLIFLDPFIKVLEIFPDLVLSA